MPVQRRPALIFCEAAPRPPLAAWTHRHGPQEDSRTAKGPRRACENSISPRAWVASRTRTMLRTLRSTPGLLVGKQAASQRAQCGEKKIPSSRVADVGLPCPPCPLYAALSPISRGNWPFLTLNVRLLDGRVVVRLLRRLARLPCLLLGLGLGLLLLLGELLLEEALARGDGRDLGHVLLRPRF